MSELLDEAKKLADFVLEETDTTLPSILYVKFLDACKKSIELNSNFSEATVAAKVYLRLIISNPSLTL